MSEQTQGDYLRVTVGDGKYTLIMDAAARLRCLRYGEEWRDLTGDGMVLCLGIRIADLEQQVSKLQSLAPKWTPITERFPTADDADELNQVHAYDEVDDKVCIIWWKYVASGSRYSHWCTFRPQSPMERTPQ